MIRLYGLPLSTYCTKVRIVLRLKGVEFEDMPPAGGHYTSPEYRANFPPGTIPFIEHDDFGLYDSEAIVEYLEDVFPEPALRSADPRKRAVQRAVSGFHTTRLEPRVRALFPLVKQSAEGRRAGSVTDGLNQFQYELERLDQIVNPVPFIGGETPCLADCAYPSTIYMGLDILDFLGEKVTFSPKISRWLHALDQHAVIGEEVGNNRSAIADWISAVSR